MKVKFIDPGKDLPASMLKLGYTSTANLHLISEVNYIVYGVMCWRSVIHYLIIPTDLTVPYWLPSDLFETVDLRLPIEWYFRYFGDNDPGELQFLMGYKEMVLDELHYVNLIERDKDTIRIFLNRTKEINEMA